MGFQCWGNTLFYKYEVPLGLYIRCNSSISNQQKTAPQELNIYTNFITAPQNKAPQELNIYKRLIATHL